jgi:hypothetical protein
MRDVRARYLTDAAFHTIVDSMRALISGAQLTPSEVREAAMMACIIEEEHRPAAPLTCSDEEMERMRTRLNIDRLERQGIWNKDTADAARRDLEREGQK